MAEIKIKLDLTFSRRAITGLGMAAVMFCVVPALNSESVVLSTYYPAPSGVYTQLITTRDTWLGRDGGVINIGTNAPTVTNMSRLTVVNGYVGISTGTAGAKLGFNDLNDGTNAADGITWYNPSPTTYGIHRTAGAWSAPNYQQLRFAWDTGVILEGGSAYGKSGTVFQPTGGNVGIGITSPQQALDVNGEIIVRNTSLADALQFTKP
jgi:hypothetical protein